MYSTKLNIKLIYFVFLLFHTTLINLIFPLSSFDNYLYIETFIAFFFYVLAFIAIQPTNFNYFFLVSLFISVISLLIGVYYDWYTLDIIGDSYRYVMPFFGFAVGLKLLNKLNEDDILILIRIIFIIYLVFFTITAISVIQTIFIDKIELFTYSERISFQTYPLLFLFLYLNFINKPFNKINILFFIVAIIFFITMLVNLSKANFILVVLFLITPLIILRKHITNTFLILVIGFVLLMSFGLIEERFTPMLDAIKNYIFFNNLETSDSSTTARLNEIRAVIGSISNNILSLFIGFGNGALLMNIDSSTGISPFNFRENGGLHHIHIEYASLIYRNGLIGLFFYLYWQLYIVKKSITDIKKLNYNLYPTLFSFAICVYFISIMVIAFTNIGFYGKISLGLLAALVIKINVLNKNYE